MSSSVQFVTDENGKKTAVVIPIDAYEELIEDIEDLKITLERKDEDTITLDELKKELSDD